MIEKSPLSEQRIIDCLKINYGIEVATLTLLPLGADIHASVYKAQTYNQSSYFIKLKRGHRHDISALIIALLRNDRIQQIIPIVKTIRGEETQRIDEFTLTVFPFIEGQNGFSRDLTDDQWCTLGKVMRHIHEINVPLSIQSEIRRESYSPKWREAVQSLYPLIESKPSGDMIAVNLLTFMERHTALIHRLVDRAEQLAKKVQDQSYQFVLCHSDLHGGNVLIDENDSLYIVDWDDPIMAPKERDLMFIGGGVANVWNNPHEKELFYKGYGEAEVNMTLLAYYRHERIVQDIAIYGQQLLLTTAGGQDRIKWYNQFIAQFDSQGVLEIAFKTDEDLP
ncbi:MAG: spectinomycin phosphotransferase [Alphaproteobacteria bacterium 16-39-46]|nr:MAG: spectinomycin phosphotransferase [Alphaproteobacteria bacterium 16-39-46]OZA42623.1 MAG: spectinomycin phosphotransferase [Alphaproteobacteria bacterium 17-39-52]HQS84389.1 aminoglycoside phosphotransferase family protein [Alphaproteobacteria bacterium]HQS93957.1 aminoglycoside phosphotransferase family protein [Alphaproteobacteria bacterium]